MVGFVIPNAGAWLLPEFQDLAEALEHTLDLPTILPHGARVDPTSRPNRNSTSRIDQQSLGSSGSGNTDPSVTETTMQPTNTDKRTWRSSMQTRQPSQTPAARRL